MNIIAIIPARGGSKGIKNKNVVDVCGVPLIKYSIDIGKALLRVNFVKECIVSTDCTKIQKIASTYGANVPFLRPDSLSTDNAKSIDFVLHALDFFEKKGISFEAVIILQPTSPIRSAQIVQDAISKFKKSGADSLISVYKEAYINPLVMYDECDGFLKPKDCNHNTGVRRQEHSPCFVRNGSIYITKTDYLRTNHKLICDNPSFMEMPKTSSINVDTLEDLDLLRKIMIK